MQVLLQGLENGQRFADSAARRLIVDVVFARVQGLFTFQQQTMGPSDQSFAMMDRSGWDLFEKWAAGREFVALQQDLGVEQRGLLALIGGQMRKLERSLAVLLR